MFMNVRNVYEIHPQLYYFFVISRGLLKFNEFTTFVIGLFFFGLLGGRRGGRERKLPYPRFVKDPASGIFLKGGMFIDER
jgi:hypothetical protein